MDNRKNAEVIFVPYRQSGEAPRRAGIARVDLDLSGLTDDEVQMLGHLIEAAECMNPIFREQFCADTRKLTKLISGLIAVAEGETLVALENYLTMLNLQNSPWSLLPRKNHLLDARRDVIEALAEKAGLKKEFRRLADYLFEDVPLSDRANFYPEDLSEEILEEGGEEARRVNTSIVVNHDGDYMTIFNEERWEKQCGEAIEHLRAARGLTKNTSFQLYLDAKIEELTTGTEEARRLADYHWVRHDSPIDIIISTAIEVYLDAWKNAKGSAAGNVTILNRAAEDLLNRLIEAVPRLEANAPWTWRRTEIDPETLPRLKFVDVASWTGDYVTGPMTTIAQSLPNDEWVGKNVGTVNMVYANTGKASHKISGSFLAGEFLTEKAMEKYGDLLFEAGQIHSALHEIGHTTGRQDPDHEGEPRKYLESEYSALEETRAELFGMWSASVLCGDGVLSREMTEAIHYSMLLSMVSSLKFEPKQAHNQARTMMFHYFEEHKAIRRVEEGGRTRFEFDMDILDGVISGMLALVGNLKAAGDKTGASLLREKYCYTDVLRPEIEERTKDAPLGRGMLFPELRMEGERYTRELVYPEFSQQRKFLRT